MATLEKAIEIAARAHAGETDRHGQPYILHPLRVMLDVDDHDAKTVAALHDVIEDTDVTIDELRQEGFAEHVLAALRRITHDPDESYADYVVSCKADPIARQVKLADLRDNANPTRLLMRPGRFADDTARVQRYVLSYRFLLDELDETDYRQLMQNAER
jgi:(p)ppGpp synthase/HD superfamily hydrolase